jgi:hypothetical protein
VLAGLMLIAVGIAAWQVTRIPASPMYAEVGATLVPAAVTVLLAVVTLFYGVSALRGTAPGAIADPGQEPLSGANARLAFFIGGCLAFSLLVSPIGFWLAATVGGIGVARAFDAPLALRTAVICSAIALAFWVLFAVVLGIELGPIVPGVGAASS